MPQLSQINIFPIKSLDGMTISSSDLLLSGALRNDRRFALRTADGHFVNGKKFAAIHGIRAKFEETLETVTLSAPHRPETTFRLAAGDVELQSWLSEYLRVGVMIAENTKTGFPDDLESPGPTLISVATLKTVCRWFPELDLEEVRRRFRTNLEVDASAGCDDCPPFWEDRLLSELSAPDALETVAFRIGEADLEGVNPCARCVVPTRDSRTGAVRSRFAVDVATNRRDTLPPWTPQSAFDHYYRLAVNTRATAGGTIRIGDELTITGERH